MVLAPMGKDVFPWHLTVHYRIVRKTLELSPGKIANVTIFQTEQPCPCRVQMDIGTVNRKTRITTIVHQ